MDDYNRRALRKIRRALKKLTRVINRTYRPHPPDELRESLEFLSSDLLRFEQEVSRGGVDVVFRTKMLRTCVIDLRWQVLKVNREVKSRYLSWERPRFERVFEQLDELDAATYGLYGPPTEFQRILNKLVQRSEVSVYRLAQLAEVDESYLRRLATGEMRNPSRGVVFALAMALRECSSVSARDIRRLIRSAGYRPPSRGQLDDYRTT